MATSTNHLSGLLDRDSSLIDVKARLLRATIRAKLDQQIVSVLNDPLKLADQSAYSNAQKTLRMLRN